MNFLKKIFGTKGEPIKSYEEFWNWFQKNEKTFFKVVKEKGDINKVFFDRLSVKLNELKEGFYYSTGLFDENTVELILTADGTVKNIVFVEELVDAAPKIDGWLFTKLKPPLEIKDVTIKMNGYQFKKDNISFYANDLSDFPDEIDIAVVHNDLNEENQTTITNGTFIFLDNFLGELNLVTSVDTVKVIGKDNVSKKLVPIEKLKDFLIWREKEFIEKYHGVRYDTENDSHSMLEAKLKNGNPLLAIINTGLLQWDCKASHPWLLNVELKYSGENTNGMPDDKTYKLLNKIEDEIVNELKDFDGYLNIGRQTADGVREIYFACKDFRKPSKVMYNMELKYSGRLEVSYDIYKDKYWQSLSHFVNNE